MRVYFMREKTTGTLVTPEGSALPTGIISTYPHKYNPDGSGYVDIPGGIVTNAYVSIPVVPINEPEKMEDLTEDYVGNLFTDYYAVRRATLHTLGFEEVSPSRWYHPALGEDANEHSIDFDVKTDALVFLTAKVFRKGFKQGRKAILKTISESFKQLPKTI